MRIRFIVCMAVTAFIFMGYLQWHWLNKKSEPEITIWNNEDDQPMITEDHHSIFNVHVVRRDSEYSSEPFFPSGNLAITWNTSVPAKNASIMISDDPQLTNTIGIINGTNDGSMAIPSKIIEQPGVYYYRIFVTPLGQESAVSSEIKWFAVHPRLTGNRIVSLGYHPFGKSECSLTVRDASGMVHMAMEHWIGDTGNREVLWLTSENDDHSWIDHGAVNPPEHTFAGLPSIAIDPDGKNLCIGYLAGDDSYHMPRPVAICHCDLSSPNPQFTKPYVFCDQRGMAWRRPFIVIDENGVTHVAWDGPPSSGNYQVKVRQLWYSNNFNGFFEEPIGVASHPMDPVGGSHLVSIPGEIHVIWEGGMWRYSRDYGTTWIPPLSEPSSNVMRDIDAQRTIRWRIGSSTRIPGTDAFVVAMIGERQHDCNHSWTEKYNLDEIWISKYTKHEGWNIPKCVYSLHDEIITTNSPPTGQIVEFIERPDVSADGSGRIYLVWDQTRGIGADQSTYRRKAYIMWSHSDFTFTSPVCLPEIGTLNNMKPLLGEARMEPGCDITWTVGEIPPINARPVRLNSPFTIQGIMFSSDTGLFTDTTAIQTDRGMFFTSDEDYQVNPDSIEPLPRFRPTDAYRLSASQRASDDSANPNPFLITIKN